MGKETVEALIVIPLFCSSSRESVIVVPLSTLPLLLIIPLW